MTPIRGWNPHDYECQPWKTKEHYMRKYDIPEYQINMRSNNTFNIDLGSSPKFNWGSFLGFKLLDIGTMVGMMLLGGFGGKNNASVATSPYKFNNNLPNMDTFIKNCSYAGSHVTTPVATAPKKTTTTPTTEKDKTTTPTELTKSQYEALKKKSPSELTDAEKAQMDAYEKKNKLGKYKPAAVPAATKKEGANISADDLKAFINDTSGKKIGMITGPGSEDVAGAQGVDNVKAASQDVDANGYLKNFTITDASGNIYALSNPKIENGVLTYQVKKESSDLSKDDTKSGNKTIKNYEFNANYDFATRLTLEIQDGKLILTNPSDQAIAKK